MSFLELQWGHGISAMESNARRVISLTQTEQLQWGHGISAMESKS
ncbi:MAG: hypothetical protein OJF51_000170 [Nitrospira sp.]|nr:MAG: hypothetical protein OJF51_000170 [Nitrospira sp.]